jgi:hypothetical protein
MPEAVFIAKPKTEEERANTEPIVKSDQRFSSRKLANGSYWPSWHLIKVA